MVKIEPEGRRSVSGAGLEDYVADRTQIASLQEGGNGWTCDR